MKLMHLFMMMLYINPSGHPTGLVGRKSVQIEGLVEEQLPVIHFPEVGSSKAHVPCLEDFGSPNAQLAYLK